MGRQHPEPDDDENAETIADMILGDGPGEWLTTDN
jgi:hypothetical protein